MWGVAFGPQCHSLVYAKTVLLVDDRECELFEFDLILKQCMGADGDQCAATRDGVSSGCALLRTLRAGQQNDFDAKRREPFAEGNVVLFCEDFRWRHERGLHAMFACANGREGGDHGFARADVALQESQHGFVFFKVFEHFTRNPALRRREFEAEVFQQRSTQLLRLG